MRDLKADLELCESIGNGVWEVRESKNSYNGSPYFVVYEKGEGSFGDRSASLIDDKQYAEFLAQASNGWKYACKQALKYKGASQELAKKVVELETLLMDYALKRSNVSSLANSNAVTTLAQELVEALKNIHADLTDVICVCTQDDVCSACKAFDKAVNALSKAKEVLGDA